MGRTLQLELLVDVGTQSGAALFDFFGDKSFPPTPSSPTFPTRMALPPSLSHQRGYNSIFLQFWSLPGDNFVGLGDLGVCLDAHHPNFHVFGWGGEGFFVFVIISAQSNFGNKIVNTAQVRTRYKRNTGKNHDDGVMIDH